MDRAGSDELENHRELPSETCRSDAPEGLAPTHAEPVHTEVEQRRRAGEEREAPFFDLAEMSEERGSHTPALVRCCFKAPFSARARRGCFTFRGDEAGPATEPVVQRARSLAGGPKEVDQER